MKKKRVVVLCTGIVFVIALILIVMNVIVPANKYKKAASLAESGEYAQAVELYTSLRDYKDSKEKAAIAQQELDYQAADALLGNEDYAEAVAAYQALGEYKDSEDKAVSAQQEIDYQAANTLLEEEDYAGAVAAFTALGEYKDSKEKATFAQQEVDYQAANALIEREDYAGAVAAFTALGEYKDSKKRAASAQQEVDYQKACALLESGSYAKAVEAFTALGKYRNSSSQAKEAQKKLDTQIAQEKLRDYNAALGMAEIGAYPEAYKAFSDLDDYNDSPQKCEEMRTAYYQYGNQLLLDGEYQDAYDVFTEVSGWTYHEKYAEIAEQEPAYCAAIALYRMDQFEEANKAFLALGDYLNSAQWAEDCLNEPVYRNAETLFASGEYEEAREIYDTLGTYRSSMERSKACSNHLAYNALRDQLSDVEKLEYGSDKQKDILKEVFFGFIELEEFSDSMEQAYQIAGRMFAFEEYDTCIMMYNTLDDYSDSEEKSIEAQNASDYRDAEELLVSAKEEEDPARKEQLYQNAVKAFYELSSYSKSRQHIYELAERYYENEDFNAAIDTFKLVRDYEDSRIRITEVYKEIDYREALELKDKEEYENALVKFAALCSPQEIEDEAWYDMNEMEDISEAAVYVWDWEWEDVVEEAMTEAAVLAVEEVTEASEWEWETVSTEIEEETEVEVEWEYENAMQLLPEGLKYGYKDSLEQIDNIIELLKEKDYKTSVALKNEGKYRTAIYGFEVLGDYSDSIQQIEYCKEAILQRKYDVAAELKVEGKYYEAITAFTALGEYSDSKDQIKACEEAILKEQYDAAVALKDEGKNDEAITAFKALGEYSDCEEQIKLCEEAIRQGQYDAAMVLKDEGKFDEAITAFKALGEYSDCEKQIKICEAEILQRQSDAELALENETEEVDYRVMIGTCYLRSEPTYGDNIIGEIYGGTVVEYLSDEGSWVFIRVGDLEGYVGARFLSGTDK